MLRAERSVRELAYEIDTLCARFRAMSAKSDATQHGKWIKELDSMLDALISKYAQERRSGRR